MYVYVCIGCMMMAIAVAAPHTKPRDMPNQRRNIYIFYFSDLSEGCICSVGLIQRPTWCFAYSVIEIAFSYQ